MRQHSHDTGRGKREKFIAEFASSYADQTESDWKELKRQFSAGS